MDRLEEQLYAAELIPPGFDFTSRSGFLQSLADFRQASEQHIPWQMVDRSDRQDSPCSSSWSAVSSEATRLSQCAQIYSVESLPDNTKNAPYFDQQHPTTYFPQLDPISGAGIALRDIENHQENKVVSGPEIEGAEMYGENRSYSGRPPIAMPYSEPQPRKREMLADCFLDVESGRSHQSSGDASDSDWKPRSTSTSKKRTFRNPQGMVGLKKPMASTHDVARAARIRKRSRASSNAATASSSTFNRNGQTHKSTAAARPFICPLAPYNCSSTFASKNEWKRHVSTQHIRLGFWRCDLASCVASAGINADSTEVWYNDFNRKDLFTQHLRRMHVAPVGSHTRVRPTESITEEMLPDVQERCYQVVRQSPQRSGCMFCDRTFKGPTSWEERMEHVGRHMEKDKRICGNPDIVHQWREDLQLRAYLIREGLIEEDGEGGWKIGDGIPRRNLEDGFTDNSLTDSEEDGECEEDY